MITPIQLSMVQRANDVSTMKQNENSKPLVEQMNTQVMDNKKNIIKHEQVNKKDNADKENTKYDAKEKGNGTYFANQQNKNKKKDEQNDGQVNRMSSSSFDVRA